ncbi:MAG: hypothetical protein J6B80_01885 [Clostridia bacterium]|nr:hypothetical protein [Clostridia bacterium]
MEIFKILVALIIAAVFGVLLRQYRPDLSLLLITITAVIALVIILNALTKPLDILEQKLTAHGIELSYFKIALKALGIGYVTSFCADICRDAGQSTLASLSEIAGKCGIFILSLPLVFNIIDLALGFIK